MGIWGARGVVKKVAQSPGKREYIFPSPELIGKDAEVGLIPDEFVKNIQDE
jgi:hypothetical protein